MVDRSVYPDYQGKKRWSVRHPQHRKPVTVTAPTAAAAMVTAANLWGDRWQSVEFYAYAEVVPA